MRTPKSVRKTKPIIQIFFVRLEVGEVGKIVAVRVMPLDVRFGLEFIAVCVRGFCPALDNSIDVESCSG